MKEKKKIGRYVIGPNWLMVSLVSEVMRYKI